MEEPSKDIELLPRDWQSDRPKPSEPFFGPGLPSALAYLIGWMATAAAVYYFTH